MLVRRIVCPTVLAALATSCRGQVVSPREREPVVLESETRPTNMQARLAAQAPLVPLAPSSAARTLDRKLDAFDDRLDGRRGYIAVDKPLYQPGETIWFRLFDLASASLAGSSKQPVKFSLIGPCGTSLADKSSLVESGGAGSEFELADTLAGGEYIVRAVMTDEDGGTRMVPRERVIERRVIMSTYEPPRIKKQLELTRKAYGPGDTVIATVALNKATGEPLAAKKATGVVALDGAELVRVPLTTDEAGNATVKFDLPKTIAKGDGLLMVLVEDGGVAESVQKRIPITLADISLQLFPEGGNLVAGLPGRVYFAAKNPLGKPADIEGRVVDDRGEVVALLRSLHGGLGRFEVTPGKGKLTLEITKPAGIAKKFTLPTALDEGCALQSVDDFASARLDARVAVACTSARTVVVTGVVREKRVGTVTAQVPQDAPVVVALPVPIGTQGALRVTVFDDALVPLAERLVYRGRGRDLQIKVKADRTQYHPRDRARLSIEARGPDGKLVPADLALAVVDDTVLVQADDKRATLLARLYLEAEMPDQKIDEPNFYFGGDPKAPAGLDLVMGTHGWRRFDWKPVFTEPELPIEDSWSFDGDLRAKPTKLMAKRQTPAAKPEPMAQQLAAGRPKPQKVGGAARAPAEAAMRIGGAAEVIQIVDAAPMIDPTSTTQGLAIDKNYIRNIPVPGRTFAAALSAAAGAQNDSLGITFTGSSSLENQYFVEGVNTTGLSFGTIGGRIYDFGVTMHRVKPPKRAAGPVVKPEPCCALVTREFPQPDYSVRYDGPRTDFRETVYWNGRIKTETGLAEVDLRLSDAITSFRVTAEGVGGGLIGTSTMQIASKKPVSLALKLPVEVSAGDKLRLPITIANETPMPYDADVVAKIGPAFRVAGDPLPGKLSLKPGERRSTFLELEVVGNGVRSADGHLAISVEASHLTDTVERTVRVVPGGFPQEQSFAGSLKKPARHEVHVGDIVPGTLAGKLAFSPSPVSTVLRAGEAIISEPSGCFEQTSSTNYPNVMILSLLEATGTADPKLVADAQGKLSRGYKRLAGFETGTRGFEWFGHSPGHEALTAYGLMQFRDMAKVFDDIDRDMVARTRDWLRARRDGKGGYLRDAKGLDKFGAASNDVTDGYITYALVEAGEKDLDDEVKKQRSVAETTSDPYLMALATRVLVGREAKAPSTAAAVKKLVGMQDGDGAWHGADHSITRSGGIALDIETTSFAALALMAAGEQDVAVEKAIGWIQEHRSGAGGYGSTQSTVLALKAMLAYTAKQRREATAGAVTVTVNGKALPRVSYSKDHRGSIDVDLREHIRPGKNVIEIAQVDGAPIPYSGALAWSSIVPAADPKSAIRLDTVFSTTSTRLGEAIHADVTVANSTSKGVPMTLARVGIPGGVAFQTWQLQELRDKKLIDYYETGPREVVLYFRSLGPKEERKIPLELIAQAPGTYVAPASRAYLYYTDEHKHWVAPATVTIAP